MADYSAMILQELLFSGWEAVVHRKDDQFVAVAEKEGQTCIGTSDGELGALIALKESIRGQAGERPAGPLPSANMSSADGEEFSRNVYVFGFEAFLAAGRGVVVLMEGDMTRHDDGRIDAKLHYLPANSHNPLIPVEAADQTSSYDPQREVVFAIVSSDAKATVVTLKLHDL